MPPPYLCDKDRAILFVMRLCNLKFPIRATEKFGKLFEKTIGGGRVLLR